MTHCEYWMEPEKECNLLSYLRCVCFRKLRTNSVAAEYSAVWCFSFASLMYTNYEYVNCSFSTQPTEWRKKKNNDHRMHTNWKKNIEKMYIAIALRCYCWNTLNESVCCIHCTYAPNYTTISYAFCLQDHKHCPKTETAPKKIKI